jgi:hypothetical protein
VVRPVLFGQVVNFDKVCRPFLIGINEQALPAFVITVNELRRFFDAFVSRIHAFI